MLVSGFFPVEQNRAILTPERTQSIIGHTPLGRFGEPDDLARATLLLASDAGRFITGTELVGDGGFDDDRSTTQRSGTFSHQMRCQGTSR